MKKPKRDPGDVIKHQLRREVNYGCPVRYKDGSGCGCPVLTFHHFDPPWAGNFTHNPDGMIALCPEHHHQADGGLFTNEQLKQFKKHPYIDDTLKVQWPWQPETLVMKVGPSLIMGSGSPFRLDGLPVFRFYPDTIEDLGIKTISFDSEIKDSAKNRWLNIKDGWFDLRLENTTNVIFTPQTKTFLAKHSDDTFISLQFKKYTLEEFNKWIPTFMTKNETAISAQSSVEKVGAVDSDGKVSVVIFEGSFKTKKVGINVKGNKMHFESFIPGMQESFDFHSWVVNDEHRAIMKMKDGPEFFSLG